MVVHGERSQGPSVSSGCDSLSYDGGRIRLIAHGATPDADPRIYDTYAGAVSIPFTTPCLERCRHARGE